MRFTVVFLTLFTVSNVTASELANGFYSVGDTDGGITVRRSDTESGGAIRLQQHIGDQFGTPTLVSLSNDNELFRLVLEKAGPFGKRVSHLAVYIDGFCAFSNQQVIDEHGRSTLTFTVASMRHARKLANALSIEPQLRQHPGHRLVAKWTPRNKSYKPSSSILLTLELKNVGDTTVRFIAGGSQRGARDNQFAFFAQGMAGYGETISDTGDPKHVGGIGTLITLEPGESFTRNADISKV